MSKTPRVDATTGKLYSLRQQNDLVPGGFARQLERELTDSLARERQLREAEQLKIALAIVEAQESGNPIEWERCEKEVKE